MKYSKFLYDCKIIFKKINKSIKNIDIIDYNSS